MPPIAYLFRADLARVTDLEVILKAIFRSVLSICPEYSFQVRSGGIFLHFFTRRTTGARRGTIFGLDSVSHTLNDDGDFRATLAVAFAESAGSRHHQIDVETLPKLLLTKPIDCVTVSDLPLFCSDSIHQNFKESLTAYVGCFEIETGDPLALALAANLLVPLCQYEATSLRWIVPDDHGEGLPADAEWASELPFSSIELTNTDPLEIPADELSKIGEKNITLINSRGKKHHAERVISSLLEHTEGTLEPFEVAFGKAEFRKADVSKLPKYCLNHEHTNPDGTPGKGRDKALLFRRLLGITRDDWLFLGEQLVAGLEKALPDKTRQNKYGVQYEVTIPVNGRNGRTMMVKCGWIIRSGEPPFLVTAFFPEEAETTERGSLSEVVVDGKKGSEYWKRVYDLAHEQATKAVENWIPTPMWIEGTRAPISDGVCGVSWVTLPDARTSFARWLKQNHIGYKGFRNGYHISAQTNSQSLELAQQYSEAFARVLRVNGIECDVKSLID